MQRYAISAPAAAPGTPVQLEPNAEFSYKNILWDPVAQTSLQEWLVHGDRTDSPGHFAPYYITTRETLPSMLPAEFNQKGAPAKIRCYSWSRVSWCTSSSPTASRWKRTASATICCSWSATTASGAERQHDSVRQAAPILLRSLDLLAEEKVFALTSCRKRPRWRFGRTGAM